MVKCPKCKTEIAKPQKTWKYWQFSVQAYTCSNCKTEFREYYDEKRKKGFILKLQRGKGYVRA